MIVLVTGGCKNGKSRYAEDLSIKLSNKDKRFYCATMVAYDDEDRLRIKNHRRERMNKGFITIEKPIDIDLIVDNTNKDSIFLIDSLTALVLNEMFRFEKTKTIDEMIEYINNELYRLVNKAKNVVIVSDYIFNEIDNYSIFTKDYLKLFGNVSTYLASISDTVIEIVATNPKVIKGGFKL